MLDANEEARKDRAEAREHVEGGPVRQRPDAAPVALFARARTIPVPARAAPSRPIMYLSGSDCDTQLCKLHRA